MGTRLNHLRGASQRPRKRRLQRRHAVVAVPVLLAAGLAAATNLNGASAELASTSTPTTSCATGTPTSRSVEHTFQRASMDPGPFNSVGYITYIRGLGVDDL